MTVARAALVPGFNVQRSAFRPRSRAAMLRLTFGASALLMDFIFRCTGQRCMTLSRSEISHLNASPKYQRLCIGMKKVPERAFPFNLFFKF